MTERAVFIGSISVWDTIGTLVSRNVEIVRLFRLVSCCVMGRKASQAPGVPRYVHAVWVFRRAPKRLSALRPPLDSGWRSKVANPGRRNASRERDGLFDIVR